MWQGGSLWLLETSRPNPDTAPRTDFHAHHAVQVVLSLGGRFRLWLDDAELAAPFAAVAPDARHSFDADGAYAILFVEPESPAGRSFVAGAFGDGDLQVLPAETVDRLAPQLAALARMPPPTLEELASLGREMIERISGSDERPPLDPRILRVIARAARDPDDPPTLADVARIAGLSPSRLSHLFVEQTGLAFKTYLLWLRLTRAVALMTEGMSLTAVAHGAGFSDSAHFSRTFRRMFGIAPASLTLV